MIRWPWVRRHRYDALERERDILAADHDLLVAEIIRLKQRLAQAGKAHHHDGTHCNICGRWTGKKTHACPMQGA